MRSKILVVLMVLGLALFALVGVAAQPTEEVVTDDNPIHVTWLDKDGSTGMETYHIDEDTAEAHSDSGAGTDEPYPDDKK